MKKRFLVGLASVGIMACAVACGSHGDGPGTTNAGEDHTVEFNIGGAPVEMSVNNLVMHPTDCCGMPYYYQFDIASLAGLQTSDTEYLIKGDVVVTASVYDHDAEVCRIGLSAFDSAGNYADGVHIASDYAGTQVPIGQQMPFESTLTGSLANINSLYLYLVCNRS